MTRRCANCDDHFPRAELELCEPPAPAWPLTAAGAAQRDDNERAGLAHERCPRCGNPTLLHPVPE